MKKNNQHTNKTPQEENKTEHKRTRNEGREEAVGNRLREEIKKTGNILIRKKKVPMKDDALLLLKEPEKRNNEPVCHFMAGWKKKN